jgi:hypothetical protein
MGRADNEHSTNGDGDATPVNGPHQITHEEWMRLLGPYLHARVRIAGPTSNHDSAQTLAIGISGLGEMLKLLHWDPVIRQSEAYQCMARVVCALLNRLEGKQEPLLFEQPTKRGNKQFSYMNWLRAVTAHPVAVMRGGGAFDAAAAATAVAQQFKVSGFRVKVPQMKEDFIHATLAWKWYDSVVGGYANKLACGTFQMLQQGFAARYPEHEQWPAQRRHEWLAAYVDDLIQLERKGAFGGR